MNFLGLDEDGAHVVEGKFYGARAIRPAPFLCPATIIFDSADLAGIPAGQHRVQTNLLFREDSFDPVTRIRRGRLYKRDGGTQPYQWHSVEGIAPGGGLVDERLISYQSISWSTLAPSTIKAKLALGTLSGYSLWDLLLIERTVGHYDLLTLRARSNLSLLPEATELSIASSHQESVQVAIDKVLDTQRRLDADATIDASRHAAVVALRAWLGDQVAGLDLNNIVEKLLKVTPMPVVIVNMARTIARLHTRTKPNVREEHGARPNEQDDGDAAVTMLGLLLRELRTCAPPLGSLSV